MGIIKRLPEDVVNRIAAGERYRIRINAVLWRLSETGGSSVIFTLELFKHNEQSVSALMQLH
ncbi:hypothetical protein ANCDUO_05716 [Ancylostoma duodenale]|uniref:Uncharacterized protein n=1 Tax=Ancylostoma duodenale TaxID=51022 RepID=A0A0C2GY20_9BILA|nr:hypothetical protein ANCDUO_05716 [Ancylostoma duodenale]